MGGRRFAPYPDDAARESDTGHRFCSDQGRRLMSRPLRRPRHDGGGRHRAVASTMQRLTRAVVVLGAIVLLIYPAVSYARAAGLMSYNAVNTGAGGVIGVVPVDPS